MGSSGFYSKWVFYLPTLKILEVKIGKILEGIGNKTLGGTDKELLMGKRLKVTQIKACRNLEGT